MEDKTFELLEQMYNEFSKRFESMDKRFDGMDKRFDGLENEVQKNRNCIIRMENKYDAQFKALFDGYQQNTESMNCLEQKVDGLIHRVDAHDIEIRVIKNAR